MNKQQFGRHRFEDGEIPVMIHRHVYVSKPFWQRGWFSVFFGLPFLFVFSAALSGIIDASSGPVKTTATVQTGKPTSATSKTSGTSKLSSRAVVCISPEIYRMQASSTDDFYVNAGTCLELQAGTVVKVLDAGGNGKLAKIKLPDGFMSYFTDAIRID
jgi:hypothetical protein